MDEGGRGLLGLVGAFVRVGDETDAEAVERLLAFAQGAIGGGQVKRVCTNGRLVQ